ncbi:MAG: hypothetical protein GY772_27910, partial [bacterium]|nr:hypothetical protein [bacterium]
RVVVESGRGESSELEEHTRRFEAQWWRCHWEGFQDAHILRDLTDYDDVRLWAETTGTQDPAFQLRWSCRGSLNGIACNAVWDATEWREGFVTAKGSKTA